MNIVLAIDDDPTVLKLLEQQLYGMKFRVFTEISARKGVETAKSLNPDVILLDLNMPEMSGFQVMENLAKDPITADIPVIILTSLGDRDVVREAIRFGIVDYVVKPYDHEKLRDKIHSTIRYSTLKRDQKAADEKSPGISMSTGTSFGSPSLRTDALYPAGPKPTSTGTPNLVRSRSVWSRLRKGSMTVVRPEAWRPARIRHDFTCALATGSLWVAAARGRGGKGPRNSSGAVSPSASRP